MSSLVISTIGDRFFCLVTSGATVKRPKTHLFIHAVLLLSHLCCRPVRWFRHFGNYNWAFCLLRGTHTQLLLSFSLRFVCSSVPCLFIFCGWTNSFHHLIPQSHRDMNRVAIHPWKSWILNVHFSRPFKVPKMKFDWKIHSLSGVSSQKQVTRVFESHGKSLAVLFPKSGYPVWTTNLVTSISFFTLAIQ